MRIFITLADYMQMQIVNIEFNQFIAAGNSFLKNLIEDLNMNGFDTDDLQCDHLCFRVDSLQKYNQYKLNLLSWGQLLTESVVNGRPISTFQLSMPFKYRNHSISIVELPAPKSGIFYETGFEHAEFIVDEDLESFAKKYSYIGFDGFQKKMINSELHLQLASGLVKFHRISLERVIEIEKSKLTDVIFDFDGTIIDSRSAIYEINRQVFSKILNRTVSTDEAIKNFHPEFQRLFDTFGVEQAQQKAEAIELWGAISLKFEFHLFDGIKKMLIDLCEAGLRLHLWTARDEVSAMEILSFHGLTHFFQTLSFSSSLKSKPHQDSLLFNYKMAPKNSVIVIGDSATDIRGAHNIQALAGAAVWCVHSDYHLLEKSGAEIFFSKPDEVTNWILNQALIS